MDSESESVRRNEWGQPIGPEVAGWVVPPRPNRAPIAGAYCRLEPLDWERHGADLWRAWWSPESHAAWTYLPYGPFPAESDFADWIRLNAAGSDPLFLAVIDLKTGRAAGWVSWMRITPEAGTIEIGHIVFSPLLQRQTAATEALFLLIREAFQLGYRRVEWKCDALNAPSRAAALRLGFQFEGIFRQALVYRGRNRDTAWYSIIDSEWAALQSAFLAWLHPSNFTSNGIQIRPLADLSRHMGEARRTLKGESARS